MWLTVDFSPNRKDFYEPSNHDFKMVLMLTVRTCFIIFNIQGFQDALVDSFKTLTMDIITMLMLPHVNLV